MTPPRLVDAAGRPFTLDRKLAEGGEGAVWTLPGDSARLAKVYTKPKPADMPEKLAAMLGLSNPTLLKLTAWPKELLFHASGRKLAGFVMPRLTDCQPIQHLYNPGQRIKFFPRAGWNFQVRAAANLAAAFDEVHKANCLVGDVNQSNAMVSSQALVWLIDCDSFQVRANGKPFLCEVGVPHYTPPELQGQSFRGRVRTENHDRFGLAVLIYQLLFVGRHPYAGVFTGKGDLSFEQMIAEYRFAQGPACLSWQMKPPPHVPTFADIPPWLGDLFRKAFERGSEANARPRPTDWLAALKRLESELVECPEDSGHKFWKGAGGCVWCRLADHGGPEYYVGVGDEGVGFAVDEARLREALRRLDAAGAGDIQYDRSRFAPAADPEPTPLPDDLYEHRTTMWVLAGTTLGCGVAIPFGLLHWAMSLIGVLGLLVFGTWLAVLLATSPWHRERRRRRMAYLHAADTLHELEARWERIVETQRYDFERLSDAVRRGVQECRGLAARHQHDLRQLSANAEASVRLRYMRAHLIADAAIPKIGDGRKQTLEAYGFCTAADLDKDALYEIPGFGEVLVRNLLDWRDDVARRFRFDPNAVVSAADQRAVTVRYRARQQQLIAEIHQQLTRLEAIAPPTRASLQSLAPAIRVAVAEYEVARADLKLMGGWR